MNIKDLSRPLDVSQIDFRVQSINKGGYATILVYKDARVDMDRLDEVVGAENWSRAHARDNRNCIVSILFNGQWISKEDVGTPANTEPEKSVASDSFKRACFNWGIGRELYDYPKISIKLKPNEVDMSKSPPRATWDLDLKEWKWSSNFEDGKLCYLQALDSKGKERFKWGSGQDRMIEHNTAVRNLMPSIMAVKSALNEDDYELAVEAYDELTNEEKQAIHLAPTKGGMFTTEEVRKMKSSEWSDARKGG